MPRRVEQTALTPQQAQSVLAGWVGLVLLALGLVVWYATNVREIASLLSYAMAESTGDVLTVPKAMRALEEVGAGR